MKKILLPALLILMGNNGWMTASAAIRLPAIIGTHMVLQQNTMVNIWGWCDPGERVSVHPDWDTTVYHAVGSSGARWSVQVKTPAAGGPYKIDISASNRIVLEDVMTGEVWDCSGQSNMEMNYNWGLRQYTGEMDSATNKSIRFFHIPRLTADYPQEDTKAKWVVCNPDDAKNFSLAGYFFGQKLQQVLSVPVGLINASWGGTPAEVWTPKDMVTNDPVLKEASGKLKPADGWPINPGATYNAMIHPIINYTIAGVIWYQGESNVSTASTYTKLFETMISTWRSAFKKDLPFYFVQIAPFAGYGKGESSALLREAQTKAAGYPNTGMVVIHDLVNNINDIHPQQKKEVGLRLADYALAEAYGKKGLVHKSPQYKSISVEKDKAVIQFTDAGNGLVSRGDTLTGFYIAGEDKVFVPAEAKIKGNTVLVWNKSVKMPAAVRFGFTNTAMPNLFGKEGLPVGIFRTDNWETDTEQK